MEKKLYYHPIIVRDNTNAIAFSCTILNGCEDKIETLDALKEAMLKFGEDYGDLNVVGYVKGQQLLCYYFQKTDGELEFRFRVYDAESGKLVSMPVPEFAPDYMSDGVNQIY